MCGICVEPRPLGKSFSINGCTHSFCTDCMVKYVASKLQENFTCIQCPVSNCNGLLEPEYCLCDPPCQRFLRGGEMLYVSRRFLGLKSFTVLLRIAQRC
ncbi:hypothetical protein L1049_014431 [Liquidambar formosana]|uniref:RING-type domain-containing protein n=1 Tax=Liquidambar formosana TaxID=63359 RepID=A0AAP0S2B5_LIQFO